MTYRNTPFWWDDAGLKQQGLETPPEELPAKAEVVVIGAGYTGLSAALTLARAGREVVVVDAERVGFGCSARNGGLIGPSFHKLGLQGLTKAYGEEKARAILMESMDSLKFLKALIESEKIDCDLKPVGRFRGATSAESFESSLKATEALAQSVGLQFEVVPKSEQHRFIGSDIYHGGIFLPDDGHLHPGKLAIGLAQRVRDAGARIFAPARVSGLRGTEGAHEVQIGRQKITAKQVLLATNGYTGPQQSWHHQRILPIRSAIIATEELTPDVMNSVSPQGMGFGDDSRLVLYGRPSPDGQRLIFGGRAFNLDDRPQNYTRDLHGIMTRIFPQLSQAKISHAWSGTLAYTFDHAPHLGRHEGVYYSMGYCGSGVGRANYFGTKIALKMLGESGATSLDDLPFQTRPLYSGVPWFMPPIIRWHAMLDRLGK